MNEFIIFFRGLAEVLCCRITQSGDVDNHPYSQAWERRLFEFMFVVELPDP